jgi:tetratricopeptide (TPR) repeat protein
MDKPSSQFIISMETECLTAVPADPEATSRVMARFLERLGSEAPSLKGTAGIFNGYAKVYCDCGHIEIAVIECDSPYTVPLIFERLQILAARVVAELAAGGIALVLANNNHSGLLRDDAAVWGTHENYLLDQHPSIITEHILPFLVTRIFGGSGGVHHPSGDFLAGVRSIYMAKASGGGTTDSRAVHSLAREEHHMGRLPRRYRYHLILGDGHRSQFNLALQLGATALAVKAVTLDAELRKQLVSLRKEFSPDWITTLREVNVLSRGGRPLQIHALVLPTQRLYLEAARRVAAAMEAPPDWIHRTLADWEQTLLAYERLDRTWLARHLDAFAKYDFYSAVLADRGCEWTGLLRQTALFRELALLDQSYHEFCHADSVFSQLEAAGMLDHRVGPRIEPGQEPEPYVPEVATRARPRARFIRDHRHSSDFELDWSVIQDRRQHRYIRLDDPFAAELGEWVSISRASRGGSRGPAEERLVGEVLNMVDLGHFFEAQTLLEHAEMFCGMEGVEMTTEVLRQRAWLRARGGFQDGESLLRHVYRDPPTTLRGMADYCGLYRFTGLCPNLHAMQLWIERGLILLTRGVSDEDIEDAAVLREHAGTALARHGRTDHALVLLQPGLAEPVWQRTSTRMQAQLLAALGETYRRMGQRSEARRMLERAMRMQMEYEWFDQLSYSTWPSLAKFEEHPADGLAWLTQAKQVQQRGRDRVGLATTLLLESRLANGARDVEDNKNQVLEIRSPLPALRQCPVLTRILDHWDAWIAPDDIDRQSDDFWGL